jgi:integrase
VEWKAPCILSIEETKCLLRTAMQPKHADLLPAIVLQLFVGGLRTEETNRLSWADIDLKARKVEISPAVGKNRRDGDWRTAKIPPNAVQFLLLHHNREGKITPNWFQARLTALHKDAGFVDYAVSHRNSKRHSFGSYGCKIHGPAWVQDQMGHNTKPTFLKFYRNAKVSLPTAKRYFSLTPNSINSEEMHEVVAITEAA